MNSEKRFSRFLVWALVALEGVSLTLVVGILYGILSRTMTREFHNKMETRQAEVSMILQDRLNLLEKHLQELSLNNTIRVSLMLGVESQLLEILERQYPPSGGAFYLVRDHGKACFYPALPEHLASFSPLLQKLCREHGFRGVKFQRNGTSDHYVSILSTPVRRKNERLGTAFVLYDISRDDRLWERLETKTPAALYFGDQTALTDLRTAKRQLIPDKGDAVHAAGFNPQWTKHFPEESLIQVKDFPGLFFWSSSLPLQQRKAHLIYLLAGLCTAIFGLTLLVSFFIAKRITDPLKNMVDQAQEIAGEPSNHFLREEDIQYVEFRKLARAFNKLLLGFINAHDELKRTTQKELDASEELYRQTLEAAPFAITINRLSDGLYLQLNEAFCTASGYTRSEAFGSSFLDFKVYETPEDMRMVRDALLKDGEINGLEVKYRRKDGVLLDTLYSARLIRFNGEECVIGVRADISELKKTEREKAVLEGELRQAQKMEAIGNLAGGIAHDFNNLLQAVQGYSDLLLLNKSKGEPGYRELREIWLAAERASELTKQLLTFSRKLESKLRPVDPNHQIRQSHKLLTRIIPKMIDIELRLASDIDTINADPAQVEQVLFNLSVNARDAMPDGGTLTISTENIDLDKLYCKLHPGAVPGRYVLISAADTGCGMRREVLEHVFEPFFTTKETGKGTGLGLAMVYGIVKNHKGHITCRSKPDRGTTFSIFLPVLSKEEETNVKEEEMPTGGTEFIMLVDDERTIRNLGKQILTRYGYRVITARNGEIALDLYGRNKNEIDLVILDLIMPGMGGGKCLEGLIETDPRAKILIASGYSPKGPVDDLLKSGAKGFLPKPFDARKLLKTVRYILDLPQ